MSTFDREGYQWRETYFVYCRANQRPSLKQLEKLLHRLSKRFELTGQIVDEEGRFESLTVLAHDDYAALDISFLDGEEVVEQAAVLYEELLPTVSSKDERKRVEELKKLDGRFDLLHFEQVAPSIADQEDDEMLDPSALLLVMDALVEMTEGIGIDPQSGTLV